MTTRKYKTASKGSGFDEEASWQFSLYVAGPSAKCLAALSNLKRLCEEHLPGRSTIEVIDLCKKPQIAKRDQIVIIPTLVKKLPSPRRTIFGDLSNTERVLSGLDLRAE